MLDVAVARLPLQLTGPGARQRRAARQQQQQQRSPLRAESRSALMPVEAWSFAEDLLAEGEVELLRLSLWVHADHHASDR